MLINEFKGRSYHLLRRKGESNEKIFKKKNKTIKKILEKPPLKDKQERKQEVKIRKDRKEQREQESQDIIEKINMMINENNMKNKKVTQDAKIIQDESIIQNESIIQDEKIIQDEISTEQIIDSIDEKNTMSIPLYLQLIDLVGCSITIKTEEQAEIIKGKLIDSKEDEIKILEDNDTKIIKLNKICFIQSNK